MAFISLDTPPVALSETLHQKTEDQTDIFFIFEAARRVLRIDEYQGRNLGLSVVHWKIKQESTRCCTMTYMRFHNCQEISIEIELPPTIHM